MRTKIQARKRKISSLFLTIVISCLTSAFIELAAKEKPFDSRLMTRGENEYSLTAIRDNSKVTKIKLILEKRTKKQKNWTFIQEVVSEGDEYTYPLARGLCGYGTGREKDLVVVMQVFSKKIFSAWFVDLKNEKLISKSIENIECDSECGPDGC